MTAMKLPPVTPYVRCRLKLNKLERIKDYLLLEEEFIRNQERLKPREEAHQVRQIATYSILLKFEEIFLKQEEREKVEELRGNPMTVGTIEELLDDTHAIVSTGLGSEYYVLMMSFVDKDQLAPSCSVLLHHKVSTVHIVRT